MGDARSGDARRAAGGCGAAGRSPRPARARKSSSAISVDEPCHGPAASPSARSTLLHSTGHLLPCLRNGGRRLVVAGHYQFRADGQRRDTHPVLRQRAGLVEADRVDRAEVFDRIESAREDLALLQRAHARCQQAGRDGRQPLGDCRNAQRHRGAQQQQQRTAAQCAQREHADAGHHHPPDRQAPAERVELLLQLRLRGFGALRELADAAQRCVLGGGDDHRAARSARHHGAEEHHVAAFAQRRVGGQRRDRHLAHRQALAGERRFVGRQTVRFDHPRVGRYRVARLEHQHVADDHLACGCRSSRPHRRAARSPGADRACAGSTPSPRPAVR